MISEIQRYLQKLLRAGKVTHYIRDTLYRVTHYNFEQLSTVQKDFPIQLFLDFPLKIQRNLSMPELSKNFNVRQIIAEIRFKGLIFTYCISFLHIPLLHINCISETRTIFPSSHGTK